MKTDKKRKRLVLLDTHAIIHRAYHALPELSSPKGEPVGAVYGLSTMLMRIVKELTPDYIVATYDLPGPTHRHEVYKEYKAKRPKADDALVAQIIRSRDVLSAFGIPLYEAPGFEADDVIGTIAVSEKKDFDIIIASGDMDTLQLVDNARVRVFTLRKGLTDTVLYDEAGVIARYGFPPVCIPDYKGELFTELGFRSLIPRVQALKDGKEEKKVSKPATERISETRTLQFSLSGEPVNEPLLKECAVMLWLTNSDITNPTLDDVLNNTRSKTLEEAHATLFKLLMKENLTNVFEEIEKPLIPVVERMNARGVLIDAPYLKELSKEYSTELSKLEKKIHVHAGMEFNISSPKQLGEVLFTKLGITAEGKRQKKTATGQLSTKESELIKLKDAHPIISEILAYRTLSKLLGTYIDAIPPLLDKESRLHTTFIQTGAATGRMASKDPGLQNIPVKTELGRRIRHAFVATPGFSLAAFDYSQIELRIAAFLSGDEKLIDIFKRGEDVHRAVASAVFRVPPEKVDHEMRRRAKVINFGILYGMGANALKMNLENGGQEVDRADAQAYLTDYFENFAGLAAYLKKVKADATRKGYTETFFGRKRYFPGLKSRLPFVRAEAERQALNAPMQGTQADIIKLAMVEIDALLHKEYEEEAYLLLQVHDELIFEIKKEKVAELAPKILWCMQSIVPPEKTKGVPILSSSTVGSNWGEMEKL
ncbi:hypothetical protein HY090_01385 [Candidatus Kaiserbacteria bacterium]|nr:hypothetical protein [Candidatus Kaiserbacteria bacterium]